MSGPIGPDAHPERRHLDGPVELDDEHLDDPRLRHGEHASAIPVEAPADATEDLTEPRGEGAASEEDGRPGDG